MPDLSNAYARSGFLEGRMRIVQMDIASALEAIARGRPDEARATLRSALEDVTRDLEAIKLADRVERQRLQAERELLSQPIPQILAPRDEMHKIARGETP